MNHRFLPLLMGLAAVVGGAASIVGQAPAARPWTTATHTERLTDTWTPPLGPDGHPELQGVWLNNSATPLERPKALEGRQFLTDEEVIELKKRAARLFDGNGNSDFAAGDNFFLAALANPDQYKNPNSTGSAVEMVERRFD